MCSSDLSITSLLDIHFIQQLLFQFLLYCHSLYSILLCSALLFYAFIIPALLYRRILFSAFRFRTLYFHIGCVTQIILFHRKFYLFRIYLPASLELAQQLFIHGLRNGLNMFPFFFLGLSGIFNFPSHRKTYSPS